MITNILMEVPQDVVEMLESDEKILWCDKPLRAHYVLKAILITLIGIPWLIFPILFILLALYSSSPPPVIALLLVFTIWFGIFGLIFFGYPIYLALVWKNIYYILTNKRLIIRGGL